MSIDVYVHDHNGNSLGYVSIETDQVITLPPRCTVKDYGETLIVRLVLDENTDLIPETRDEDEA